MGLEKRVTETPLGLNLSDQRDSIPGFFSPVEERRHVQKTPLLGKRDPIIPLETPLCEWNPFLPGKLPKKMRVG